MAKKSSTPIAETVEEIKTSLRTRKKPKRIAAKDLLSSGSTLLNLACSGRTSGAFAIGTYNFFVGDSASGKSWLCLTCLAEAAKNSVFDNYRFIYDNAENGAFMDMETFFGKTMAKRLEAPAKAKDGSPIFSDRIEDFYFHVDDALNAGPCIYILDSMDSLSSEDEEKKFQEKKKAMRKQRKADANGEVKEEKVAGSYGDGKAKKNSSMIRQIKNRLKQTGSILIIINQTRDNIGAFTFEKKTRSGGHALRFYANLEMWSSIAEHIKTNVRSKPVEQGIVCKVQVKKNRLTGRQSSVEIPIYHSAGIDDVGSMIDYLIDWKHWTESAKVITAPEFEFTGKREALLRHVEENDMEMDLKAIVAEVWAEVEQASSVERKQRYN